MTNYRTLLFLTGLYLTLPSVGHAQMRTWHDTKGGEMRGRFLTVLEGTVTLSSELRNVEIPFWNLDPNDQLWILRHMRNRRKHHLVPKVSDFPRTWKTVAGRRFEGQLLQSDHREVVIVIDAQKVKFDLKAISAADVKYVSAWRGPIPGMKRPESVSDSVLEDKRTSDHQKQEQSQVNDEADSDEKSTATTEESQEADSDHSFEQIGTVLESSRQSVIGLLQRWPFESSGAACVLALLILRLCRKKKKGQQRVYDLPDEVAQAA